MTRLSERHIPSPVGLLRLVGNDDGVCGVYFVNHAPAPAHHGDVVDHHDVLDALAAEFAAWFAGTTREFQTPLSPTGTPFQQSVWAALRKIPFGETCSYGALAAVVGDKGAVRAVAAANAHNPLSIVVPCHRVVGQDGKLTGYAGGVHNKRWLLDHEARLSGRLLL